MDGTRLETAGFIEKLPDYTDDKQSDTQPGTQATGASSPALAQTVTANGSSKNAKHDANIEESHDLSPAVAVCHSEPLNTVSRFESPSLRHFVFCL
jgi:hypothetical protein